MNMTITSHEEDAKFHIEPSWNGITAIFRIFTKHSTMLLTESELNSLIDQGIAAQLELEWMKGVPHESNAPGNPFNNKLEF